MAVLSDAQIEALIREPKPLPADWAAKLRPRVGRIGNLIRDFDVEGGHGTDFRLIIRQSAINVLDFSVILGYRPGSGPRLFRLRRYNGRSHEHRNRIEGDRFYDFHIHQATERYQALGGDEDAYAMPTDRFADLAGAIGACIEDCSFRPIDAGQLSWLDPMILRE